MEVVRDVLNRIAMQQPVPKQISVLHTEVEDAVLNLDVIKVL
jgi:hypothetical protein